jgi:hypothetical protein
MHSLTQNTEYKSYHQEYTLWQTVGTVDTTKLYELHMTFITTINKLHGLNRAQ